MPHFVLEYSDNLDQDDESIQELFAALHSAAEQTGLFPFKGLRSRAYPCSQHRMADGNPQHGFAHLEVKIGVGRSLQERKQAAESLFHVYTNHFAAQCKQRGVAISFEMRELEPVTKFNKNNVQDYL